MRITAESIWRTLEVAGEGKSGVSVEVVFPIDPEAFFGADTGWTAEPLPTAAR